MADPLSDFETIVVPHPNGTNRRLMHLSSVFSATKIKCSMSEEFYLTTEIIDNLIGALEQARPAVAMLDLKVIDQKIEEKKKVLDAKQAESEKARLDYEGVVQMKDRLMNDVGLYIPAQED